MDEGDERDEQARRRPEFRHKGRPAQDRGLTGPQAYRIRLRAIWFSKGWGDWETDA